jgi:predicted dehydrogenase
MSEPIRVGLIGYGFAGRTFHAPLIAATPGLSLVAVASRDAAKVEADLPDAEVVVAPEELFPLVDLVVVASPNDTHAPLAAAALDAGRAVVVDKPFTLDLAQARAVAAAAERAGGLLAVFHNRRFDSDFLSVRAAVEAGRVGRVTHFESHFDRFRPQVRDRWRERAGPGGGIWADLGPHLIDQALQLFGPPERIVASLAVQRDGGQADDWAHAVLEYDRLRVVLHASMLVAGGAPRFVVHGTEGGLRKRMPDRQEAQLLASVVPGAPGWGEDPDPLVIWDGEGRETTLPAVAGDQRRFYAGVRDALLGLAPNPVPPVEALAVMAVLEAAAASAREGRAVAPDLSEPERAALAGIRTRAPRF